MNNEIIPLQRGSLETFLDSYTERLQMAEVLLKSKFLPQAYTSPEQVLAVMLTAHELNIPPMQALRTIDIIQGQPTLSPELMLALIRRTGELESMKIEDDGRTCTVTMKRRGELAHVESFGMDDAERMMTSEYKNGQRTTIKLSDKYNWKSMPKVMRKWRAIGACARVVFPDVLGGMYLREEVEDSDFDVVDDRVHEDEPQVAKPEPVQVASGVTLPTFDPRAERITWGKYGPANGSQGMFWCEIDQGYLQWAVTAAKKPTDREKAAATLQFLDSQEAQKQDAEQAGPELFGGVFDDPVAAKSAHIKAEFLKAVAGGTLESLPGIAANVAECVNVGQLTAKDAEEINQTITDRTV